MTQVREIKISLVGESNIGKTCFINRLSNKFNINSNYASTLGVDVIPIDLHGNQGKIRLCIWDCGGTIRGLKEKYHINSQGAIIFKNNINNNHKKYEKELPHNIKKVYIEDYNIENPDLSNQDYKNLLYESFINIV